MSASVSKWFAPITVAVALWAALAATGCSDQRPGTPQRPDVGVIVLAGGGSGGDAGAPDSWSARLFRPLLQRGDVTGDRQVRVALVGRRESESWPTPFWKMLGATDVVDLVIETTEQADDPALEAIFDHVDAVFIRGGDQGKYYDLWNNRRIERCMLRVHERGGGIGGTSAGAMSLAHYALAGSTSVQSEQVLRDSHHPILNDESDGGSAIHEDFIPLVRDALIDTHVTQRGRLGRMCGALARAVQDSGRTDLYAIGLDQQVGVVIEGTTATVIGIGAVDLIHPVPGSLLLRRPGKPLVWTDLVYHRLTEGWRFDVVTRRPDLDRPPTGAMRVDWDARFQRPAARWEVRGSVPEEEQRFSFSVDRKAPIYELTKNRAAESLSLTIGMCDVHDTSVRGFLHESLFRGLYDVIGLTAILLGKGSRVWVDPAEPRFMEFGANADAGVGSEAALVVVSRAVKARSLSPHVSLYDRGHKRLHAAGFIGAALHVLADSAETGIVLDMDVGKAVQRRADDAQPDSGGNAAGKGE
ncbi:MAG: hypothetical protein IPM64_02735 [Phycisphaerales bacterium]|nr:hypothetical protein [Phycisphaerales bacterium]